MLTYQQAVAKLGSRDSRKIAHETWLEWGNLHYADAVTGQHFACPPSAGYVNHVPESPYGHRPNLARSVDVRYHDTAVVTIHPDGCFTLRTGGWYTATTKRRIRDYSPAALSTADDGATIWPHGIEFREGMTVDSSGRDVDHIAPEGV